MLMQLGDFQFSIPTVAYTSLQRRSAARWARIPLLGGYEVLHAVGNENDRIILQGSVYPQMSTRVGGYRGTQGIDVLREMLHALRPYLLQAADGRNFKYWIIEKLDNVDSNYLVGGTPRRQDFRCTLRYYGETAQ